MRCPHCGKAAKARRAYGNRQGATLIYDHKVGGCYKSYPFASPAELDRVWDRLWGELTPAQVKMMYDFDNEILDNTQKR